MKIAAITDIGSCRQENQDNYCAQQLAGGTAWGIVCDGMGGVNGGRIAARIATDTMQQYFARHMKALQPGDEKRLSSCAGLISRTAPCMKKSTSDPEMHGHGHDRCLRLRQRRAGACGPRRAIPARTCSTQGRCGRSRATTRWCSSWWTAARSPGNRRPSHPQKEPHHPGAGCLGQHRAGI